MVFFEQRYIQSLKLSGSTSGKSDDDDAPPLYVVAFSQTTRPPPLLSDLLSYRAPNCLSRRIQILTTDFLISYQQECWMTAVATLPTEYSILRRCNCKSVTNHDYWFVCAYTLSYSPTQRTVWYIGTGTAVGVTQYKSHRSGKDRQQTRSYAMVVCITAAVVTRRLDRSFPSTIASHLQKTIGFTKSPEDNH